jgi:hypothetical protein
VWEKLREQQKKKKKSGKNILYTIPNKKLLKVKK